MSEALGSRTEHAAGAARTGVFDGSDVIALVSHGHDGLRRRAMGNVTEHVLCDSKLPLLIVPSQRRDKWGEDEQEEEEKDYGAVLV
jgi:nucleotide-binding universal stress UspA family protein